MNLIKYFFFPEDIQREKYIYASSIARIIFSLILIHRHLDLLLSSPVDFEPINQVIICLISSFGSLVGLLTPISLISLAIFDSITVSNLGSQIVIIACVSFFLSNSWMFNSIDSFLLRNFKVYQNIFSFINLLTFKISTVRTITIYLWGAIYLTAVAQHLPNSSWHQGTVVLSLLRTPYQNDFAQIFESIDTNYLLIFSKLSTYGMLIWEGILWALPGIKIVKKITFVWGLLFFISCTLFINISYLAYTQIVLWILIYYPYFYLFKFKKSSLSIFNNIPDLSNKLILSIVKSFKLLFKIGFFWSVFLLHSIYISTTYLGYLEYLQKYNVPIFSRIYKIKNIRKGTQFIRSKLIIFNSKKYVKNINKFVSYHIYGQDLVNVFNHAIYQPKYNLVACRYYTDGSNELVPYADFRGGRLSYLANDAFFFQNVYFQREYQDLNWNDEKLVQRIEKDFREISLGIAKFDFLVNKKDIKIDYYKFFLVEHFPYIVNKSLFGWDVDRDFKIRSKVNINKNKLLNETSKFRINLPPGHKFKLDRTAKTESLFCN